MTVLILDSQSVLLLTVLILNSQLAQFMTALIDPVFNPAHECITWMINESVYVLILANRTVSWVER